MLHHEVGTEDGKTVGQPAAYSLHHSTDGRCCHAPACLCPRLVQLRLQRLCPADGLAKLALVLAAAGAGCGWGRGKGRGREGQWSIQAASDMHSGGADTMAPVPPALHNPPSHPRCPPTWPAAPPGPAAAPAPGPPVPPPPGRTAAPGPHPRRAPRQHAPAGGARRRRCQLSGNALRKENSCESARPACELQPQPRSHPLMARNATASRVHQPHAPTWS